MDVVKENMKTVGEREEDGEDRARWKHVTLPGDT